jgi:hypothetical protein
MCRARLIVASRSETVVSALTSQLRLFLPQQDIPHKIEALPYSYAPDLFEFLDALGLDQLRETMMVLDADSEGITTWDVNDIGAHGGLAARLIMSYPEVYFVFLCSLESTAAQATLLRYAASNPGENDAINVELIRHYHFVEYVNSLALLTFARWHAQGFRTLFDATGLRSILKRSMIRVESGAVRFSAPLVAAGRGEPATANKYFDNSIYEPLLESRWTHAAAVAEEEEVFVYLNGYAVYKAGYRAWLLTSLAEFERILPDGVMKRSSGPSAFPLIVSDWDLQYADLDGSTLSQFRNDPQGWFEKRLNPTGERLIVISSYKDGALRLCSQYGGFVERKPYAGIFSLFQSKLGHSNPLRERLEEAWLLFTSKEAERKRQVASKPSTNLIVGLSRDQFGNDHSAPYARLAIATSLLTRACSTGDGGAAQLVQRAMLAGEAKELLSGMSRTTAFEAIVLQNDVEVRAELSFLGIASDVNVKDRIKLLEEETAFTLKSATHSSVDSESDDRRSQLDCLQRAVDKMRSSFTSHNQIKPAEECVRQFARYERELESHSSSSSVAQRLAARYFDWATGAGTSVQRVLGVAVGWMFFFWVAFFALAAAHPAIQHHWGLAVKLSGFHSGLTFVQLQPGLPEFDALKHHEAWRRSPGSNEVWLLAYFSVTWAEVMIAYLHLAILGSVLYRRLTNRAP